MASNSIITTNFPKYLSQIVKTGNSSLYFAIGSGDESWGDTPTTPSSSISSLVSEQYRELVSTISYMSESDPTLNTVSGSPTAIVRISVNIDDTKYTGTTREYGLFFGGTSTAGSGTLISYCNHPPILIPSNSTYAKNIFLHF